MRIRLEAPSQVVTDSRLLEWLSAQWVTELALGSQIRTFLSLEVVANTLPSAFHDRLWKTSSSLLKALKVHANEWKRIRLNAEFRCGEKRDKSKKEITYSWALVACECPTRSWHFLTKWKAKNRRRDGTRRFLFDADEHESTDTRASSMFLTIHTLECSIIWSIHNQNRQMTFNFMLIKGNFVTMESWDPVANKPSSKGEKSRSVTKSEWAWRSG